MNKKRLTMLLGALLLIGGILYGQVPFGKGKKDEPAPARKESPTLRLAQKIYREMTFPERDDVCAMDFTITTVDQSYGTLDTTASSVHYLANRNRVHYRSPQMSFFQDQAMVLALVPERKTIFLARSSMDEIRRRQQGIFSLLQDSLFSTASIVADEPVAEGRSNRALLLKAGEGMRTRYRIDRVSLKMNTDAGTIQEIHVDFLPGHTLRSATMTYDKVEWLKSTPEFERPILDIAFAKNGQTLPEYREYRVIDKRGEE